VVETRSWSEALAGLDGAAREAALLDLTKAEVAASLGHSTADEVDIALRLDEMGFDSLASVELRNRLSAAAELALPPTLVFDHPDVPSLVAYLGRRLAPGQEQLAG
jgi:acyl carrier protein